MNPLQEKESFVHKEQHDHPDAKSRKHNKRGMKPRSKRNRKRPRNEVENQQECNIHVNPLELDGMAVDQQQQSWFRTIEPYPFTFSSFAKARWVGRTILDVYHSEFGSYPKVRTR